MKLSQIALGNLRRRKQKHLFSVLSLAIGVAVVVAIQAITGSLQTELGEELDQYGANIVVVPKSDSLNLTYGGINVGDITFGQRVLTEQSLLGISQIKDAESISIVAPKVIGAMATDSGQALVVGIKFTEELALKKWWSLTGNPPQNDQEVILGSEVASKGQKKPGDTLVMGGETYTIASILSETGSQDDHAIFLDLTKAQEVLNLEGKVSLVEISALCNTCPIEEISAQLTQALPEAKVTPLKQAVVSRMTTTERISHFALAISVVVIIISSLVVLTTILSSVNDRTREIGILRSIGYRRSHITSIILIESVTVGAAGGLLGIVAGYFAYQTGANLLNVTTQQTHLGFLLVLAFIGSIILALLASLPGIFRATTLDPVEAIRVI